MRDDFASEVKRILAARVGNHCCRPECRALTSGPASGGPRYDPSLSPEQRCHADNGIWLCQNCAKLVDNDVVQFPVEVLRAWKILAEHHARFTIGKIPAPVR